jgi:hypothetical protein
MVIGFPPEAKLEGRILEELAVQDAVGTVRVLDLLFVRKDAETGELTALDAQGENLGEIAGALLGFEPGGGERSERAGTGVPSGPFGISRDDLESMAAGLEPGQAAAAVIIEHVWARDLKRAVRETGGVPLAEGFLTPELVEEMATQLAAASEAKEQAATSAA